MTQTTGVPGGAWSGAPATGAVQGATPATAAASGARLFPSLAALAGAGAVAPAAVGSGPGMGAALNGATGAAPPAALAALVDQAAQAHGLSPSLLAALVQEESGFDPAARSPVGAMGLTQLMPATAAALGVTNPYDPVENLNGGAAYLSGLIHRYGGNVALALAAYNAGPGAVDRWGGIPPYPETQRYVQNVLALAGLGSQSPTNGG
jgi:soluble lytic murein transglycosylase-like protein